MIRNFQIPNHIGIRGNEAADVAAKESLSQEIIASQVPYTDLKPHINSFVANKWQERWLSCPDNTLFEFKPTLGDWPPGFRNSREEEVVFISAQNFPYIFFSFIYFTPRRSSRMHNMSGDLLCQTRFN